jgi:large subunit ribosomal protein L30
MAKIAIVRIRGIRNIKPDLSRTMDMLNLSKPHYCTIVEDTPQNMGMVRKVKDYVTFGSVSEETIFMLLSKRGEKGSKRLKELFNEAAIKKASSEIFTGKSLREYADPVFRLSPPRGGTKNIKMAYPLGALGARDDIDSLIRRMV